MRFLPKLSLTIILISLFLTVSVCLAGVSGIVSDSATGLPVSQAWVKYTASDSIQTSASGAYAFAGLAAGTYQVVVKHNGYYNRRQQVILVTGNNTVNLLLRPLNLPVNPVGWWNFENPANLTQADVGNDLVLQGTQTGITGPDGSGAINIGVGSYYHCYHDIPANGGSTDWVNEFSLQIDFRVSQLGRWYSFYQTSTNNGNDADGFINTNGNIGVGVTGYSTYAINPNEWYRLIISVDLGSSFKYYLDGQLVRDGGIQLLNGRFALYPSTNGNQVLLFADDDAEDNPIDVAQVAIYNSALTAAQASTIGGYGHVITDPAAVMTPYLQSPTATSMSISWHYLPSTQSFVDYGTTQTLGQTTSGTAQLISASVQWHTVQLINLLPNTTYFYRCRSDTATTPIARFHTPPVVGSRSGKLRFMLISDSQTNISRSTRVAAAMRETLVNRFGPTFADSVQLVAHCGDITGNGLDLATFQTEYFLPFAQINQSIPFMVSIGNHEAESSYFYDYMKYEPFAGPEGERYYSFQMSRVLFIVLNSNTQGATQATWFGNRLQSAQADTTVDMIFVMTHRPGHSEIWPDGNTDWVQNTILPLLDNCAKVVMISFGHTHAYERGARPSSAVRTVLCGGAGGSLDRWRMYTNQTNYPEIHHSFDYHNYILIDVDLANRSYEATAYTLGNDDHPLPNVPFDYWRQALGQPAPATPECLAPIGGTTGYLTLTGSSFIGSDTIQSSQIQVTSIPGNYSAPMINSTRDYEDYYSDSGAPNYIPINQNLGIQLTELDHVDTLLQAGHSYGWRLRYRDRNLLWSAWSPEATFTWQGPDTVAPDAPHGLTIRTLFNHVLLRWAQVPGVNIHYHIYRDTNNDGTFEDLVGTTTGVTFTDSSAVLQPAVQRFYLVKAER